MSHKKVKIRMKREQAPRKTIKLGPGALDGVRRCPKCSRWRPLDQYCKDPHARRAIKVAYICKSCSSAYNAALHQRRKAEGTVNNGGGRARMRTIERLLGQVEEDDKATPGGR